MSLHGFGRAIAEAIEIYATDQGKTPSQIAELIKGGDKAVSDAVTKMVAE